MQSRSGGNAEPPARITNCQFRWERVIMIGVDNPRRWAVGKRRGGPVPKLTPERQKAIVDSVAAGVPRALAATRAGITERCLYQWLAKGRNGGRRNEPYVQLFQALQKAEADAVARNVALVQKAATKSWQAGAWWL